MRLPSKSRLVLILLGVSAVALLLPPSCVSWVRGLFQPVALVQEPVASGVRTVAGAVEGLAMRAIPQEEARRLLVENEELRRQIVAEHTAQEQLREAFQRVTGLRDVLPDSDVTLVLAPVASYDADPRRESLRIRLNSDTAPLVRPGQWVAAGLYQTPGRELLRRQWLIGRISEVQTRLARVQLATDPGFPRTPVRIATLGNDGKWILGEEKCLLEGIGGGRMWIGQVKKDYHASGELMVMVPASRELPFPLSIGQIESSERQDDSPLHYDLTVVPWGSADALTHVFVITRGS